MANVFAGSEMVEIGIQIEKNGRDFYNTLTTKSKNKKAAELFKFLAGEEEKHIAVFKKILDSAQRYVPQESYSGEYSAYMKALADEYIFTKDDKGLEVAKKIKNDKAAVDMGIGFEKDSILFYIGMNQSVQEDDHEVIEKLIAQEKSHLEKLTELKKSL